MNTFDTDNFTMSKSKSTAGKPGRPKLPEDEKQDVKTVSLPKWMVAFAEQLGGGKLSRGVQIAIQEAHDRHKSKTTKQLKK
jgi:hypothetical protein